MTPVPEGDLNRWMILINKVGQDVGIIELVSKYGTLTYGMRPEGYPSWVFAERGGGGATTLPYARTPDGQLLVALIGERRANIATADGIAWCIVGGFVDPGETHQQAAVRELDEETLQKPVSAEELPGVPGNSNRLFFVTDVTKGEGVRAWGMHVPFDRLEADPEADGCYRFRSNANVKLAKPADTVRFFPWKQAVKMTPDQLARAAIAQLLTVVLD